MRTTNNIPVVFFKCIQKEAAKGGWAFRMGQPYLPMMINSVDFTGGSLWNGTQLEEMLSSVL